MIMAVSQRPKELGSERDRADELNLKVLYEDPEIVVVTAPNESELKEILLNMLKSGPKTLKDLHLRLAGIASEDKIRRCMTKLIGEGVVVVDRDGYYRLLGYDGNQEELEEY